jgi:DNA-binding NarL/FixJ family response regulator
MAPTTDALRVLVVSPDPIARAGLAAMVGAQARLALAGTSPPDDPRRLLLQHDAALLLWDGAQAEQFPPFDVPVVVALLDAHQAGEARAAGARGLIFRDGDGDRLAMALETVALGLIVLDDRFAEDLLRSPGPPIEEALTPREREVLEWLSHGLTNKELAAQLHISVHTAKFHVAAILDKLEATTRTEAVMLAARLGLLLV